MEKRKERLQQIRDILEYQDRKALTSSYVYDLSDVVRTVISELLELVDIIMEEDDENS